MEMSPTTLPARPRPGPPATAMMGASPALEHVVRVRIHITPRQRAALIAVLDRSPEPGVRVSGFTASIDLADPIGWLEARMAEWPRGAFPRASLHGVTRRVHAAIQGQVQPDLPPSQEQPDLIPAILRRADVIEALEATAAALIEAATQEVADAAELDLPSGRYPELRLGGEL